MGLRKYSITFLMSTSATDSRQIPAYGASVEVYRQGAKVTSNTTVLAATPTTVNVRSVGALAISDTVQAGTDTARTFTVTELTSATAIKLQAIGGNNLSLLTNERLVVTSAALPILYDNDAQLGTPLANPATADSNGYIEFYTPTSPFDMIVRRSGMSPEIYEDQESGTFTIEIVSDHLTVTAYADVATALTEAPAGSRLYFPITGGPYTPPTTAGWTISKSLEIYSDGPGVHMQGLQFRPFEDVANLGKNSVIFAISDGVHDVYIHDCNMTRNSGALVATDGTGDFIRVNSTSAGCAHIRLKRIDMYYPGRNGVRTTGPGYVVGLTMEDMKVYGARGHGYSLDTCTMIGMTNVWAQSNYLYGFHLQSCANASLFLNAESNGEGNSSTGADGQVVLQGSYVAITGGNIEDFVAFTAKNGIVMRGCLGCTIGGMQFDGDPAVGSSRGIYMTNGSIGNTILSNNYTNVQTTVEVASAANDIGNFIAPQCVLTSNATTPGNFIMPAGHRNFAMVTNIVASVNDNKGVGILLPCMSSAAAIDASVLQEGLLFYDINDHKVKIRLAATTIVVGTQV